MSEHALFCKSCNLDMTDSHIVAKSDGRFSMYPSETKVCSHCSLPLEESDDDGVGEILFKQMVDGDRPASKYDYWVVAKHLGCKIKNIFANEMFIPRAQVGTFLKAVEEHCQKFKLEDTCNFLSNGSIAPPTYEKIQLNSTTEEDFMTEGYKFYDTEIRKLVISLNKVWGGMIANFMTVYNQKDFNKELRTNIETWANENNFLKNEKFSLSGKFLKVKDVGWDDMVLKSDLKNLLIKTGESLADSKKMKVSKGLLFMGPHGTGKTASLKVLMKQANATFIWVTAQDIDKGCSMGSAFELARELAPTILAFEDIDAYLGAYAVDLFKTELDGLITNEGLCVVLTTNFPEHLPTALLDRPGRFHDICNFDLPDKTRREELIKKLLPEVEAECLKTLIAETESFSCDHLRELVDFAKRIMADEGCDIESGVTKSLEKIQQQRFLVQELQEKARQEKAERNRGY